VKCDEKPRDGHHAADQWRSTTPSRSVRRAGAVTPRGMRAAGAVVMLRAPCCSRTTIIRLRRGKQKRTKYAGCDNADVEVQPVAHDCD